MTKTFIFDEEQQQRVEQKLRAALEDELNDIYDADFVIGDSMLEQSKDEDVVGGYNIQFAASYTTAASEEDDSSGDEEE